VQRCSFSLFFETPDQVNTDIGLGYPYHVADVLAHVTDRAADFRLSGRTVFCSDVEISNWAGDPIKRAPESVPYAMQDWIAQMMLVQEDFPTRRERRLNASIPSL
jgi:hypothetical protein